MTFLVSLVRFSVAFLQSVPAHEPRIALSVFLKARFPLPHQNAKNLRLAGFDCLEIALLYPEMYPILEVADEFVR